MTDRSISKRIVEGAGLALLIATVFICLEMVFLGDIGYRGSNPAALLSVLTMRQVAPWFVVLYPVALVGLYVWFAITLARQLPQLLVHHNVFAEIGKFSRIAFTLLTIFAVYLSFPTSYALYAWVYHSCDSVQMWNGVGVAFQCNVLPEYSQYSTLAIEQFIRGLFGDFVEIIDPTDPLQGWHKDPLFISVTALYRLFAQTALFVVPLALWNAVRLVVGRR